MAVLDNKPRSATATAEEPTTVYFICRTDMEMLLDRTPRLAGALAREIIRRFRQFNRREVLESERLALVGRFASSIVHDLKNPLNIIGISADMAAMPTATPESRQASTVRIRKQVERISNMVNELLEFTQGAHTNVIMALIDYKAFVEQLIDEIRPEAALKSVTIEYVNPPPSVLLRIDPQRLSRVFHNLIGNAADAMATGGKVKLSFSQNGKEIITELQDTGKGIAPEISRPPFPGLRHLRQSQRHRPGTFHLQENRAGPSGQNLRPKRGRWRRSFWILPAHSRRLRSVAELQ